MKEFDVKVEKGEEIEDAKAEEGKDTKDTLTVNHYLNRYRKTDHLNWEGNEIIKSIPIDEATYFETSLSLIVLQIAKLISQLWAKKPLGLESPQVQANVQLFPKAIRSLTLVFNDKELIDTCDPDNFDPKTFNEFTFMARCGHFTEVIGLLYETV